MLSTCRTCLKNNGFLHIFDIENNIAPMIMACASIKMQENDGLPLTLCNDCFGNLKIAYTFRQLCESSDLQLRQKLSGICESIILEAVESVNGFKTVSTPFNCTDLTSDIHASSEYPHQIDNNIEVFREVELSDAQEFANHCYEETLIAEKSGNLEIPTIFDTEILTDNSLVTQENKIKEEVKRKRLKRREQCQHCGKIFEGKSYLKLHILTHSGERPHQCSVCAKKFVQRSHLVRHMNSHAGKKPHQCKICGLKISNLQSHLTVHSDIRMFVCSICSRGFKRKRELKCHIAKHTGVKDYQCEQCSKSFIRISYLNKHVQCVHLGEKKHKCKVCGKMFAKSSNLQCHFRIHTGEQPYECKTCRMAFNQPLALKRHMKCHDPKESLNPKSQSKSKPKGPLNESKTILLESAVNIQPRKKQRVKKKNQNISITQKGIRWDSQCEQYTII